MRVQKYLSEKGICSRREAEEFIRRGLVSINGRIVTEMGVKIDPEKDIVELAPSIARGEGRTTSVVIYKPRGVVSSRIRAEGKTVYDLFPQFLRLNIVGRLDKESEGLLLLSNDGVIARAVTGDEHLIEKEYEVTVQEKISPTRLIRLFAEGINLEDGKTLPAKVKVLNENVFRVILKEGRKHQIRRMCEALRLTAVRLKRLRIGSVLLGKMKEGEYRSLTKEEANDLRSVRGSVREKNNI